MHLIIKLFNGEMIEKTIPKNTIKIGRSNKCDLIIPHDGVSREHLLLEFIDGQYYVTDLNSRNGVFIDSSQIEPSKRTRYLTTLQLTFGSVQSLEIDLDENNQSSEGSFSSLSQQTSIQDSNNQTRTIDMRREKIKREKEKTQLPSQRKRFQKVEAQSKLKTFFTNLLAILILCATAYWYWNKKNATQINQHQQEEVKILE